MASIEEIILQWQRALKREVDFLQNKGGARFLITDGKFLSKNKERNVYWFLLANDMFLPDGAPIRVEIKDKKYYGTVVSVEGFDLVIELNTNLGESVEEAYLYSEPWELLNALGKRLNEILYSSVKQKRVIRLLSGKSPVKHDPEIIKDTVHEVVLRAKHNATTYIWGPPGTGKTYTLSRLVGFRYFKKKKILVLGHSNAAVDVLMYGVTEFV